MSMSVKFNGVELNEILDVIQGFTPFGGADMATSFVDMETGGSTYAFTTRKMKIIDMPFIIKDDYRGKQLYKYDLLQTVLNVDEPKPLEFGAMPNRVFYAMPNGDLSYDETVFQGIGSIQWVIGDGLGHIKVKTPYIMEPDSDGLYSLDVMNNGSEWASLDFIVENPEKENGYIGISSPYGAIQLGYPEESDTTPDTKSVLLTTSSKDKFSDWVDGRTNYQDSNKDCSGTLGYDSRYGGWLMGVTGFANPNNKKYYGALKECIFPTTQSVGDFYIWARAWIETYSMGQTGCWTLCMIDTNKKVIAGMTLDKHDRSGNTAEVTFFTGNGSGGVTVNKRFKFQPTTWVKHNPYSNEGRLKNSNMFDIRKSGNKVRFFWYGGYYEYTVPDTVKNAKAERCQFYVGQFKGRNTTTQMISRMGLADVAIYANKVPYERDVPNRYPALSKVEIRGEEKRSYFNGQLRLMDEVKGTRYFKIPPGKTTTIQARTSSWAVPRPKITVYVNEVMR